MKYQKLYFNNIFYRGGNIPIPIKINKHINFYEFKKKIIY